MRDKKYIKYIPDSDLSDDAALDDTDNDPSYEVLDSDESNDLESSGPPSSDSEESDYLQLKKPIMTYKNNKVFSSKFRDVDKDTGSSSNDFPLITENQIPVDSAPNFMELDDSNEVEKSADVNKVPFVANKYTKKRTFCKFCKDDVTNFERHLERNHKDVKEVREMLQFPKKSKERAEIIQLIRKDGNFEEYLKGKIKPMYKSTKVTSAYVPCAYCKGLYAQSFLYRHYKKCPAVTITKDSNKIRHVSASQTLIACSLDASNTLHKLRVKEEVFNIMKADQISLVAKTDTLIYLFGEQYLKKHKRAQMAVVCSNKMRELARLLIELRTIEKNEKFSLIDAMTPSIFDKVLECAKRVGGYDPVEKSYRAPSLSAHLGTSLKQACDLLITTLQRKQCFIKCDDPEAKIQAAKNFKDLIATQWTTEISSLAFKDLNEKRWNKPIILPLTRDILKFKNYVNKIANIAVASLQNNPNNAREYKNLVNATLTLTILYNRRRIGDVQYTKFQAYLTSFSTSNQEEFMNSLSSSEKVLTRHYKRVVTGGKGSKPTVILFPQNLQDLMNTLIDIRLKTDLVSQNNQYLFAHPGSDRWIRADTVIRQFAQKCNLDHPEHISSNKLRKQIATVMQILNLSQDETEQFAQFMGHTEKTHNEFYKLPQDIYQTAKVSKLLILMDKGDGNKYKGKSLNEIDINPEVDAVELEDTDDDDDNSIEVDNDVSLSNIMPDKKRSPLTNVKSCKQIGRTPWTPEQAKVVKNYFKKNIQLKKAPKKQQCEELIRNYPDLLKNKDWIRIKTYIYNLYRDK